MIVVGLTGSVGMGKSTTADLFRREGVPVFDADAAVHDLYRGAAVAPVAAVFPEAVRAGVIDRAVLGRRVFEDPAAMRRLEAIVHPLVAAARARFIEAARRDGAALCVLDVPLLFETGGDAEVDAVVVVSAPEPVQKARVMARPGMTEARFAAILAKQMPDADKRRRADFIIDTGRGLDEAAHQVRDVIAALTRGAGTPVRPPA